MKIISDLFFYYWGFLLYPFLAFFSTILLTRLCIIWLPKLGYVDNPGGRHIHKKQVPRGGGVAIIMAFFLTLAYYVLINPGQTSSELFWRLLIPSALLGIIGMIDDRRELSAKFKLVMQILVATLVWSSNNNYYTIFGWQIPPLLSLAMVIVWIVVLLNAFNLIDGLDGLAAGLAIVTAGCMAIWFFLIKGHSLQVICMLILVGACLGFLRYNFHPAKIFLGDTGSTFLGLMFAISGLSTIDQAVTATSLLLPLLAIGVPLFDVILAIWRRSVRKLLDPKSGGIMVGDQDHLHHRLLRKTKKQTTTAYLIYLLGCGFAIATLILLYFRNSTLTIGYVILLMGVLIAIRQLAGVELHASAKLILHGVVKPRRGLLINLTQPFIDFFLIAVAYTVACLIVCNSFGDPHSFITVFASVSLLLCFAGTYRIYWLRAGLSDYWRLRVLLFFGTIFADSLLYILEYKRMEDLYGITPFCFLIWSIIFTALTMFLIGSERLLIFYAEWFYFRKLDLKHQNSGQHRVLLYGGGLKCRIFIDTLYCAQRFGDSDQVVGIVDDDPVLTGLRVYGFPILGNSSQLEKIYKSHPFDKLLIANRNNDDKKMQALKKFCEKHEIVMSNLIFEEEEFYDPKKISQY
ncbi:MAG: hypothetical protein LBM70_02855 [Victivallales bacterium]|nr:hypothetical protein [Victivallales bacterium]